MSIVWALVQRNLQRRGGGYALHLAAPPRRAAAAGAQATHLHSLVTPLKGSPNISLLHEMLFFELLAAHFSDLPK